ncbi:hypothetical protein KL938_005337 [Ogataea parapolymorpha]|nr:hypothetical protein KL938_005337 [Ogataea parapolymorpha]
MNAHKYAYAFALSILEYPKSIPLLFRHLKDYLLLAGKEALLHDESNYSRFVYDGTTDSYNLCHFWTNLELGDLDVFRSQEYNEMFEYLDRQNGFFYERWGDAPVRSLILSLILKKGQIHRLADIGYIHEPYLQFYLVDHDEHAAAREAVLAQHPAELNKVLLEPMETGTVYHPHEKVRLFEIIEPERPQRSLTPDVPDIYVEAGVRNSADVEAHRGARFLDVLAQHALDDRRFAGIIQTQEQ